MLTDVLRSFKSQLQATLNSTDNRAKIQDSDFIIGVAQAVAQAKGNFSLADLRRSACLFLGTSICRSSFNERLGTASLTKSLQIAFAGLLTLVQPKPTKNSISLLNKLGVDAIIGIDASMATLWDGLCEHFKGTFMTAALKLHLAIDLISGAVQWHEYTAGAVHDSNCFPELVANRLYIYDLGYWSHQLLLQIKEAKAFFLSRVKSTAKLTVIKVVEGMGKSIVGQDLLSVKMQKRRNPVIELVATMCIDKVDVAFRVIGFWYEKERAYRWYITNLKCSNRLIYELYRLRWQIELSFKALKSTLNFDRMPTLNQNAVISLGLFAMINFTFAMILRNPAQNPKSTVQKPKSEAQNSDAGVISMLSVTKIFATAAQLIFNLLKLGTRITAKISRRLTEQILPLLKEGADPNYKSRKTTIIRLQNA